jgi:hypothetical protein
LLENKLHSFLEDNNKRTCSPQKKCSLQFIVITNERKGNKRVFFYFFTFFRSKEEKKTYYLFLQYVFDEDYFQQLQWKWYILLGLLLFQETEGLSKQWCETFEIYSY